MKRFLPQLLLLTIFSLLPIVSFAQVSKIVFTTNPQSVKPGALSLPITIQTQDSAGNLFQTPETIDLEFVSTSATGEFLGSTGNPVTAYMSKNTANKTFYYKDSNEGNFTITINAKVRDGVGEWDASQQISVSSGSSLNPPDDTNPPPEVLGASSESISSGGGTTNNVSSLNASLDILAGSDRITSPGSPIWFQATVKKNTTKAGPELNWSFGDGNVGVGPLVSHAYKYPGDYVVILSSRAGDIFSVSRLKVKVVESDVMIEDKDEYLEISNNSNTEINLFNWKIENKGKGFIFQPNTIISPKSKIKLDKSLLTMKGLDNGLGTTLKNAMGKEVFVAAMIKEIDLKEIYKNIANIKNEALVIQSKIGNKIVNTNFQTKEIVTSVKNDGELKEETNIATSTENIIYEAPKSEGFFIKLTNFIKRVFSN